MEKKNFDYDEISDSLIISNKKENEIVEENFVFDDIVLSLTTKGKISSVEISNISDYLSEIGLNPKMLENIKNAELKIIQKRDSVRILVNIDSIVNSKMQENKIPLGMIPMITH